MGFYTKLSKRLLGRFSTILIPHYTEINVYLKMLRPRKEARMRYTLVEFLSVAFFTSLLIFCFAFPLLVLTFLVLTNDFLFSYIFSFSCSVFITLSFFYFFITYPKILVEKMKKRG